MEVTKSANPAPGRPASVAIDFLMLAGVSIIAGLITAAVAAGVVILLSGQSEPAATEAPQAPTPAVTANVKTKPAPQ
jgi:hypothetical protein